MNDQQGYKLSLNRKTGELQLLPQKAQPIDGVEQVCHRLCKKISIIICILGYEQQ